MSDLIDRQKAIDTLSYFKERLNHHLGETDFREEERAWGLSLIQYCMDFIRQMPSAKPEPYWIPCSERLPEVGQDILMSVGGIYTAEGCLREDGDWAQFRWDAIQRKDMVGAWMPLPEPYTERSKDE